jgi:hypothetical protein
MAAPLPPTGAYQGITFHPTAGRADRYRISMRATSGTAAVNAVAIRPFELSFADAETGARTYDCVHLLLHGPFACTTNFPYTSYTAAALKAAAERLRQAGCDVEAAVAVCQRMRGPCAWGRVSSGAAPGEWVAETVVGDQVTKCIFGPFTDPRAAARAADAALLVLEGPSEGRHPCLNFPLASYSEEEIQAARAALGPWVKAWVGTEQLSGEAEQRAADLLETLDGNIKAISQVGKPVVVCVVVVCLEACFLWARSSWRPPKHLVLDV